MERMCAKVRIMLKAVADRLVLLAQNGNGQRFSR